MLPDEPFSVEEVGNILTSHGIKRLGGLRAFYFEDTINNGVCYINGAEILFHVEIASAVKLLCNQTMIMPNDMISWSHNANFVELVTSLLNQGFWFLTECDE
jgi:50S ribosomal protein L16 3-hydroxylase